MCPEESSSELSSSSLSAPVCVLGMSRSGTSLTMRVLNVLGVELGNEDELVEPLEGNNPAGFWEHGGIMELNEEILRAFDPTPQNIWRDPPPLPEGWQRDPRLTPHRRRARLILQRNFAGRPLWGWKDPRNCLTLPFWQELVPTLRYVICVRDPRDVAASLAARDGIPHEEAMALWSRHMVEATLHTSGGRRIFVSFESYFPAWEQQVERLAGFLDLPVPSEEQLASIDAHFDEKLWHHRGALHEAASPDLDAETADLFAALSAQAEAGVISGADG
jgi:hypothetical protein